MDPTCWDECLDTVEYFKKSKHKWSIRYAEVQHKQVNYTDEQKRVISTAFARKPNFFYFHRYNRLALMHPELVYENKKTKKVPDNYIVLNRLNNFKGWECSVGVDFLSIRLDGSLKGTCENFLYNQQEVYNIHDQDFDKKFLPTIASVVCDRVACRCPVDANMPKKKIIPIYENRH
jgi:hypothetical protein